MPNKSKSEPNKTSRTQIIPIFSSLGPVWSSLGNWMICLTSKISSEFISEAASKTAMNPMLMLKTLKSEWDAKSWAVVLSVDWNIWWVITQPNQTLYQSYQTYDWYKSPQKISFPQTIKSELNHIYSDFVWIFAPKIAAIFEATWQETRFLRGHWVSFNFCVIGTNCLLLKV